MIFLACGGKTEFYITDSLDAQKLYNSARNVEIAAWKLANAPIDPDNAEILGIFALAIAGDNGQRSFLQFLLDTSRLRASDNRSRQRMFAATLQACRQANQIVFIPCPYRHNF